MLPTPALPVQVRQYGAFTAGWQLRPNAPLGGFLQMANTNFAQQLNLAHAQSSYAVAYSPSRQTSGMLTKGAGIVCYKNRIAQ